jgi:hypothetical protein
LFFDCGGFVGEVGVGGPELLEATEGAAARRRGGVGQALGAAVHLLERSPEAWEANRGCLTLRHCHGQADHVKKQYY